MAYRTFRTTPYYQAPDPADFSPILNAANTFAQAAKEKRNVERQKQLDAEKYKNNLEGAWQETGQNELLQNANFEHVQKTINLKKRSDASADEVYGNQTERERLFKLNEISKKKKSLYESEVKAAKETGLEYLNLGAYATTTVAQNTPKSLDEIETQEVKPFDAFAKNNPDLAVNPSKMVDQYLNGRGDIDYTESQENKSGTKTVTEELKTKLGISVPKEESQETIADRLFEKVGDPSKVDIDSKDIKDYISKMPYAQEYYRKKADDYVWEKAKSYVAANPELTGNLKEPWKNIDSKKVHDDMIANPDKYVMPDFGSIVGDIAKKDLRAGLDIKYKFDVKVTPQKDRSDSDGSGQKKAPNLSPYNNGTMNFVPLGKDKDGNIVKQGAVITDKNGVAIGKQPVTTKNVWVPGGFAVTDHNKKDIAVSLDYSKAFYKDGSGGTLTNTNNPVVKITDLKLLPVTKGGNPWVKGNEQETIEAIKKSGNFGGFAWFADGNEFDVKAIKNDTGQDVNQDEAEVEDYLKYVKPILVPVGPNEMSKLKAKGIDFDSPELQSMKEEVARKEQEIRNQIQEKPVQASKPKPKGW